MTARPPAAELALKLAQVAYEKKGQEIKILDVSDLHSLIECFVLVTALNSRHAQVLGQDALSRVKQVGLQPWHLERADDWICGDFGDVVLHVFTEDARRYYDLDHLWADAPLIEWSPTKASA
ncbi:MAG: ribosome silencing factor [Planctomycetes bacterium]|nr:ribosome silencing factor [Planctomycetota bacterium]